MVKSLRILVSVTSLLLLPSFVFPGSKDEQKRLKKCSEVLGEILDVPDNVPQELLDKAECVVIMPSVKKFAFGFGGSYGKGAMICRGGKNFTGAWGRPGDVPPGGSEHWFSTRWLSLRFSVVGHEYERGRFIAKQQSEAGC